MSEGLEQRKADLGDEVFDRLMRFVLLETIDHNWKEHLYAMDHLKHGIGLESYGQKDPRLRFKEEGFRMFVQTLARIQRDILRMFFRIQVELRDPNESVADQQMQGGGFCAESSCSASSSSTGRTSSAT